MLSGALSANPKNHLEVKRRWWVQCYKDRWVSQGSQLSFTARWKGRSGNWKPSRPPGSGTPTPAKVSMGGKPSPTYTTEGNSGSVWSSSPGVKCCLPENQELLPASTTSWRCPWLLADFAICCSHSQPSWQEKRETQHSSCSVWCQLLPSSFLFSFFVILWHLFGWPESHLQPSFWHL